MSESTARGTLFVGALSSSLIALGLIAQASRLGQTFDVFTLVLLPILGVLGVFTFVRLIASSVEDLHYGRAINRIRGYYLEHAKDQSRYFALVGLDDTAGVLANMGISHRSRWQRYWTLASMVAVLTLTIIGITVAFLAVVSRWSRSAGPGQCWLLSDRASEPRWRGYVVLPALPPLVTSAR